MARKKAKVDDFKFHDYRYMAQTVWSIDNVPAAIAMKMAVSSRRRCVSGTRTSRRGTSRSTWQANLEKAKKKE
jgi:hypothetical protein